MCVSCGFTFFTVFNDCTTLHTDDDDEEGSSSRRPAASARGFGSVSLLELTSHGLAEAEDSLFDSRSRHLGRLFGCVTDEHGGPQGCVSVCAKLS